MRSILLHVDDDASLDDRMQAALSLARTTSGHVTCLHATPIEAYVAFDSFGGVFVMEKVMEALDEQEALVKARVEERFGREDVSWDYRKSTGSLPRVLLSYGALADVIVTGRAQVRGQGNGVTLGLLGDIVMQSRIPVLLPATTGAIFNPLGKAVIGWNGSYEAANAVRASIQLLKNASSVDVLRMDEPGKQTDTLFPSTRLLEYLSRHEIHAELLDVTADGEFVGEALTGLALERDAYLVLGGYGHSRIGEYLFGGVTREMLESSPVNLVIAH